MIYILIPVKDRIEQTLKCIQAFKEQTYKDYKIIIIDDGSIDGTADIIRNKWNDIEILEGDGNLWCMGAFAKGVDFVRKEWKKGDYILTQNQDTYFEKDFLNILVSQSEKYNRAIIGASNYSLNEKRPIYTNVVIRSGTFKPVVTESSEEVLNTDTLATRGTIFPVEVFEKIGNFSKLFPHYAGDYEICARAKRNGFKLLASNTAIVYSNDDNHNLSWRIKHKKEKTLKDIWDLYTSRRSPSNLYYSILLTILCIPFPKNILGVLKINASALKFIFWDFIFQKLTNNE